MENTKYFMLLIAILGIILILISCKNKIKSTQTVSHNKEILKQIIDIKTYKPKKISFKYNTIDYSVERGTISIGNNKFYLEALLYFNTETFDKIKNILKNKDTYQFNTPKDEFNFDWLPKEIKNELLNTNHYKIYNYKLFQKKANQKFLLLNHKVLLIVLKT